MEKSKKELRKIRRKNAKLYPIYKMFSWDLLFFYSIEFLFYTITKKITVSEILIINGFYILFKIFIQVPSVMITDFLGKRKSIILGNVLLIFYILILIYLPGIISIIIANFICALGYGIKKIAETNLLYDSVSTKGGEGLYSKLDTKGGSFYYLLNGISSLVAGYLFVINNYLPMYICLVFIVISTILSFGFKDVLEIKKIKKEKRKSVLKNYTSDLKQSFKFFINSKRMKAFILFQIVFCSIVEITGTYNSDLLIDLGISEQQFSMIFAILSFIGGISLSLKTSLEKRFKNRTLKAISFMYVLASIVIGVLATLWKNAYIIPIVLVMLSIQRISTAIWFILESKYIKNFTQEENRHKITFVYEFLGCIFVSIFSIIGGIIIKFLSIEHALVAVSILGFVFILLTLGYMKNRFGLKPQEYTKEDIEFETIVKL